MTLNENIHHKSYFKTWQNFALCNKTLQQICTALISSVMVLMRLLRFTIVLKEKEEMEAKCFLYIKCVNQIVNISIHCIELGTTSHFK